ncbi:hypothetical protein OGAPHI_004946 [Ogataea philodendri]|uniref:Uncharacterized protein n=1 Tax=Ogataea philodendri TaxID=1378263 RepID=A0A9P8T320_9ASCO|nr:uncharacterized protein OGAPHI_004946 [Ogataea philodendri]KAH3663545.1 hypothetical protein OGAPHI_004946 [Ogataea philodendri]
MFTPVNVISFWVIVSSVSTSTFLSGSGTGSSLSGTGKQVLQLKGLNQVRVPDHGSVGGLNSVKLTIDFGDLFHTLVQNVLFSEHSNVLLHALLHLESQFGCGDISVSVSQTVEVGDGLVTNVAWKLWQWSTWLEVVSNGVRHSSSENDKVQQGVGSQTVGTVHRCTSGLTTCEKTRHNLIFTLLVLGQNLTGVLGWNTTHVVMHGWQNWNWLLGNVHTGENVSSFRNTWQSLLQHRGWQVGQLQVHVIFVGTNTSSSVDFHGDSSGNHISGSKILGGWCVSFHKSLTLAVQQVSTFSSGTFSDQTSRTVDTRRMELDKLQVLQWETCSADHGISITGTGVGRGTREVSSSVTTCGNDRVRSLESVKGSVLLVVCNAPHTFSVVHQQVHGKELDEVVGVVSERLTVQSVQKSVTGSVCNGTSSVCLTTLTELLGLTAKGSLVNLSLLRSREWKTVVFQLDNRVWGFSCHVVDGVLVSQPVRTFDSVVHVPSPFVRVHVTESGVDTTLSCHSVRSGWEQFRDTGNFEALLGQTKRCSKTGTTGTNHDDIVFVVDDVIILGHCRRCGLTVEII